MKLIHIIDLLPLSICRIIYSENQGDGHGCSGARGATPAAAFLINLRTY